MAATTPVITAAPLDIGRDEARDRAREELSTPEYAQESSSWLRRGLDWLWQRVLDLVDLASGGPAGRIVIGVVAGLLIVGIVLIIRRTRPDLGRRSGDDGTIFGDDRRTAAEYRTAADTAAHANDWSAAVVERFRAVAAELEERGVVDRRPGRTADELAREAGVAMPPIRSDLTAATAVFDAVRYGGHEAGPDDHGRIERLDDAVRHDGRTSQQAVPAATGPELPR